MKNLIKHASAGILYHSSALRKFRFNTRVLAFHKANPEYFEGQMAYLKSNFRVVPLLEAVKDLNRMQVVITFDDGHVNTKTVVYPVLKKLGLSATVFVCYDFAEKNIFPWWDRIESANVQCDIRKLKKLPPEKIEERVFRLTGISKQSPMPEHDHYMDWRDLEDISDVFEVGSHTTTHAVLTRISFQDAEKEISESRINISKKTGKNILSFAYPNGDFNNDLAKAVEQAGYTCALTYRKGNNSNSTSRYKLFRRGINFEDDLEVFACKVAGVF